MSSNNKWIVSRLPQNGNTLQKMKFYETPDVEDSLRISALLLEYFFNSGHKILCPFAKKMEKRDAHNAILGISIHPNWTSQ